MWLILKMLKVNKTRKGLAQKRKIKRYHVFDNSIEQEIANDESMYLADGNDQDEDDREFVVEENCKADKDQAIF